MCDAADQRKLQTILASNFKDPKPKKKKKRKVIAIDLHAKQLYQNAYKKKTTLS